MSSCAAASCASPARSRRRPRASRCATVTASSPTGPACRPMPTPRKLTPSWPTASSPCACPKRPRPAPAGSRSKADPEPGGEPTPIPALPVPIRAGQLTATARGSCCGASGEASPGRRPSRFRWVGGRGSGWTRTASLAVGRWSLLAREVGMPRRIVSSLVFLAATAGLIWAGWPGAPANPATLVNRVDVIAAVVMLAGLPWLARRVFGPAGDSWLARIVRAGGYAAVFALVLVKAEVERPEYAAHSGHAWLAGVWAGEIIFLVVIAAYVAGLLAVTARRPPFSPEA